MDRVADVDLTNFKEDLANGVFSVTNLNDEIFVVLLKRFSGKDGSPVGPLAKKITMTELVAERAKLQGELSNNAAKIEHLVSLTPR